MKIIQAKAVNVGDLLNRTICERMGVNCDVVDIDSADAMIVGSMIQSNVVYDKPDWNGVRPIKVFGTGYIQSPEHHRMYRLPSSDTRFVEYFKRPIEPLAFRGALSRARALVSQYQNKVCNFNNVFLGDFGLYVPQLFPDITTHWCKYRIGWIPHYIDKGTGIVEKFATSDDLILDIQQNPREFIHQLTQCSMILSSSLHGLIFADAFGIPNARLVLSDNIIGGDYKFNDYYSAFGLNSHVKYDLRKTTPPARLAPQSDAFRQMVIEKQRIIGEIISSETQRHQ